MDSTELVQYALLKLKYASKTKKKRLIKRSECRPICRTRDSFKKKAPKVWKRVEGTGHLR